MPKVKSSRKVKFPKGWEVLEDTLAQLQEQMREGHSTTHTRSAANTHDSAHKRKSDDNGHSAALSTAAHLAVCAVCVACSREHGSSRQTQGRVAVADLQTAPSTIKIHMVRQMRNGAHRTALAWCFALRAVCAHSCPFVCVCVASVCVRDMYYNKKEISKEVYEFALAEKYADQHLIAKWKKVSTSSK